MFGMTSKAMFGLSLILIALVLAAIMTVVNVAKSESEKEKRYVMSACFISWLIVALCMLLVVIVPKPYDYIPLTAVIFIFPATVYRFSIRHQLLREKDRREQERGEREDAGSDEE